MHFESICKLLDLMSVGRITIMVSCKPVTVKTVTFLQVKLGETMLNVDWISKKHLLTSCFIHYSSCFIYFLLQRVHLPLPTIMQHF